MPSETRPDVLVVWPILPDQMRRLDGAYALHRYDRAEDKAGFLNGKATGIRAVVTTGGKGFDAGLLARLPNLELVASSGVGTDTIDVAACRARGVPVTNTPDVLNNDVADLGIGLIIAALRQMPQGHDYVRSGDWARKGMMGFTSTLTGRTLGIVGLGRIGNELADRARALKMKIAYHGRRKQDVPYDYYADLRDLARASDVLALTCPGGAATRGLIGAAELAALGSKGWLVNLSRGTVVDEPSLIAALRDGTIRGAGLDVYATEPNVDPALRDMPFDRTQKKTSADLRSARWFAPDDLRSFGHRSRIMQMGYAPADYMGKPIIGILNTWSDLNPCHAHFKSRVDDVKRGVLQAGGFPAEMPAITLSESFMKPTTMLYRNLLAMEVEEQIRSHPVDGVVLMGGCDKTTPGLIMGALSAGIPMILLPAGPMLRGNYAGHQLGSGSDAWKYWDERRAGNITDTQWLGVEGGIARSYGHCMTMGTASTMTAIADAMGLTLPGASSIPAPDANHIRMSADCGRRIVDMVWEDLTPGQIFPPASVRNAATVAMATGCSTNAVIHLLAMAHRGGVPLTLDDLDALGRATPLVANVRPSGTGYLMEDFFYAGGLLALMNQIRERLDLTALTVTGKPLGAALEGAEVFNDDVIRPLSNPVYREGSLAVLRGNLAPDGAVIKPAACDPRFHVHQGPAMVFDSYPEMKAAIDDENLDVTADHVLVLRNAGPLGGPGMPEWGMLPIPKALVKQGHRDMLRLSDARMSGTSYGACVLHVAPEAHVGGPLALLRNGDIVRLDLPNRRIDMLVDDAELAARRAAWIPPPERFGRGYGWAYARHVSQADQGCDFDFLAPDFGKAAGEPDIY